MVSAPGLLLSDDLLFSSRIAATARSLGLELRTLRSAGDVQASAAQQSPACVILDLANPSLNIAEAVPALKTGGARIIAYGSHVDTATLQAARDAGCDIVLPRSKFVEQLPTEMTKWFGFEARSGSEGSEQ